MINWRKSRFRSIFSFCSLGILLSAFLSCSGDPFENSIYSEAPEIGLYQDYIQSNPGLPQEGIAPILTKGAEKGIITKSGLEFKDSNGNGKLDPYEDWRLAPTERAENLVSLMTVDQKLGLFSLDSKSGNTYMTKADDGTYLYDIQGLNADGSVEEEINKKISRAKMFIDDHIRYTAIHFDMDPMDQVKYANNLQGLAERLELGIPVMHAADPDQDAYGFNEQTKSRVTLMPFYMGLGAADDLSITKTFGEVVSSEFRMTGVHMILGPICDLATEPRYARIQHSIHATADVTAKHIGVLIKGLQGGNELTPNGVAAVMKHFPGSGAIEEGMDSHTAAGQYNVYPGGNFEEHLKPFIAAIDAGVAGVMSSYSIIDVDEYKDIENGKAVDEGAAFSTKLMKDLLRDELGFTGMSTSDWNIDSSAPWGHEDIASTPELFAMFFNAGVSQFGGKDRMIFWREAYEKGLMNDEDIDREAIRLLELPFKLGLFENPYVDVSEAETFWDPDGDALKKRVAFGEEAMKQAMVMAKNDESDSSAPLLPVKANDDYYVEVMDTNGNGMIDVYFDSFLPDCDSGQSKTKAVASDKLYLGTNFVSSISDADILVVRTNARGGTYFGTLGGTPLSWEAPIYVWDHDNQVYTDEEVPVNTEVGQYRGGMTSWVFNDWSQVTGTDGRGTGYKSYLSGFDAKAQVDRALAAKVANPDLKVIVGITLTRPVIVSDFVDKIDGLLFDFAATDQAFLDVVFWQDGDAPGGTLPVEIPSSDASVEAQDEDVPGDSENPTFKIGYGLTYSSLGGY